MKIAIALAFGACFGALGCGRSTTQEWQKKYADCQVLQSVMQKDPSAGLAPPDCEALRAACEKNPRGDACRAEMARYTRK